MYDGVRSKRQRSTFHYDVRRWASIDPVITTAICPEGNRIAREKKKKKKGNMILLSKTLRKYFPRVLVRPTHTFASDILRQILRRGAPGVLGNKKESAADTGPHEGHDPRRTHTAPASPRARSAATWFPELSRIFRPSSRTNEIFFCNSRWSIVSFFFFLNDFNHTTNVREYRGECHAIRSNSERTYTGDEEEETRQRSVVDGII